MERNIYDLRQLIAPENLTAPVLELLRIEGSVLTTDLEGYDCSMEGQQANQRFFIVQKGLDRSTGFGLVQYLYVVDGHLVAAVWFGGDDLHDYSFTFNTNETLILVPPSEKVNPCNQYIDEHFAVHTITEYWIAEKKA